MYKLYILIFTSISFSTLAQRKSKYASREWYKIGIAAGPNYAYRILDQPDQTIDYKKRQEREIPKFGYHVGGHIQYKFKNSLIAESGIRFSGYGYQTRNYFEHTNDTFTQRKVLNYSVVEIPLRLRKDFGTGPLQLTACIGISPGVLSFVKHSTFYNDQLYSTKSGWGAAFNLFATAMFGCNYDIADNVSLHIQPEFNIGLVETEKHTHYWAVSLDMGCSYKF